jgi:hypothetical protein
LARFTYKVLLALGAVVIAGCAAQGGGNFQAGQNLASDNGKTLSSSNSSANSNIPNSGQSTVATKVAAQPTETPKAAGGAIGILDNVSIRVDAPRLTDPRWAGTPVRESKLNGLFVGKPMGNCNPCFPRVAITIKDYSETLVTERISLTIPGTTMKNPPRPDECVKFDATVWITAKSSEFLKNIVICNAFIKPTDIIYSQNAMNHYEAATGRSPNTNEIRTTGPKSPARLLDVARPVDEALWRNGFYLFGNTFGLMGYQGVRQWEGVMEDRLWFVNMAKK